MEIENNQVKNLFCDILLNKYLTEDKQVKKYSLDCDYKIFITGHPTTGKKTLADKIAEK